MMQSGDVLTKYVTHKDHYYVSIVLSFSVSGQTVPTNRVLLANHHVSNIRQLRWSSVMLIVSPGGGHLSAVHGRRIAATDANDPKRTCLTVTLAEPICPLVTADINTFYRTGSMETTIDLETSSQTSRGRVICRKFYES